MGFWRITWQKQKVGSSLERDKKLETNNLENNEDKESQKDA